LVPRRGKYAVVGREAFLRYADWLFARALTLREAGDIETAEKYEQRAVECLDQAILDGQQQKNKQE
jgi:hypothetical protein